MSDTELRRPSTWAISIGMAAAYTAAAIMGTQESGGAMMPSGYYAVMFVRVAGTFLALIHGTHLLLLALSLLPNIREWWHRLRPLPPPAPPALPPPPTVRYTRIVPGMVNGQPRTIEIEDTRPERWSRWQQTAYEVLAWYRVTGSLVYGRMVGAGRAFARNEDCQAVYQELDRVGLIVLANGRTTTLADTLPSTLAIVRAGKVEWTSESDPAPIAPAPLKRGWQSDNLRESYPVVESQ